MKKCTKCQDSKPFSEFERRHENKNKYHSWCKDCRREYFREYNKKHKERRDKQQKQHYYDHKEQLSKRRREKYYADRSPRVARYEVEKAVKSGDLKIPPECESCGHQKKLEGHHEDYSKPLDIIWLCMSCHRIVHAKKRRETDDKK